MSSINYQTFVSQIVMLFYCASFCQARFLLNYRNQPRSILHEILPYVSSIISLYLLQNCRFLHVCTLYQARSQSYRFGGAHRRRIAVRGRGCPLPYERFFTFLRGLRWPNDAIFSIFCRYIFSPFFHSAKVSTVCTTLSLFFY